MLANASSSNVSTQTPVSSSWSEDNQARGGPKAALPATLDSNLRLQLFRSLTRIERHLKRRDPEALRCIREWYSAKGAPAPAATAVEEVRSESPRRRRWRRRRRKKNLPQAQRRMEQNEISNAMLEYLEIPEGVATRCLLVPPQPAWLFSDEPPPLLPAPGPDESMAGFRWLVDSNVNNAKLSSRRLTEREVMRQQLDRWIFLFFRILRRNWESCIVEEKRTTADANMYAEENIQKWTRKLRFKILRQAPIKVALNAFLSRMGLVSDTSIVFCRDGFYGLMDVGNAYGDVTKTPCNMISFNSTPRYMGLKNGDSIYVNSCNTTQRQMMEETRQDAPMNMDKSRLSFENEEGEGEFDVEVCTEDMHSESSSNRLDFSAL